MHKGRWREGPMASWRTCLLGGRLGERNSEGKAILAGGPRVLESRDENVSFTEHREEKS